MNNRKILLGILILAFFIFSPTLSTYFSQDDWVFLSHVYKQPFTNIFRYYPEAFYRPIGQQLFFWVSSALFGLDAGGFHLLGLIIHLVNIVLVWKILQSFKSLKYTSLLIITLYAISPIHLVALNWLTQIDLEISVFFSLLTIRYWKKTVFSFPFFIAALFSHETAVMVPIFIVLRDLKGWRLRMSSFLLKPVLFLAAGASVLISKYLVNPFPFQSDYSLQINLMPIISTTKWYILRVLFLPEGIRLLPLWLQMLSVVALLSIVFTFRMSLIRSLCIFSIGLAPVLFLSSHSFSVYALVPLSFFILLAGRGIRRDIHPFLALAGSMLLITTSFFIAQTTILNHWTTVRGKISQDAGRMYAASNDLQKDELKKLSSTSDRNKEIYFSTMKGRQFLVLDRGTSRGIFDVLFFRGNDLTTQFLPDALFFKESLLHGKFPFWNPWVFAGMPSILDPQNFILYPPNYVLLFLPLELGFFILLIGHVILAGYFVKKLLMKYPAWIQWTGIFLYLASPKLVSHLEEGNWTLLVAAAWLPALYYALREKKFRLLAISLSALIINNLNIGYYAVLFVVLYFVFLYLKRDRVMNFGISLLLVVGVVTAPRWIPLALFGGQTVRGTLQESPLPFWSWGKIAKSLLFPLAGGHPFLQNEEILYVGIIPILLIAAYFVFKGSASSRQGRALRNLWFWSIWICFVLLVAFNIKTPFFSLIQFLPGFSLLRITTRPWIFISLFIALAVPSTLFQISKKSKVFGIFFVLGIMGEFGLFGYQIFARRVIPENPIPFRFYQAMSEKMQSVRAYCTTGCLDRLTAQRMGIALLEGNNPIQLTAFVRYLEKAGGYHESTYHPILPPYTVFSSKPQPDAKLLGETSTSFVISPYVLTDAQLTQIDQEGAYRLYENKADIMPYRDHYFSLEVSK